jgi:hypothetical protein
MHLLSVNNVHKLSSEFLIKIEGLLKQSRPGYRNPQIHLNAYSAFNFALEVEAARKLWAASIFVSMPDLCRTVFIHLATVSLLTSLCGLT